MKKWATLVLQMMCNHCIIHTPELVCRGVRWWWQNLLLHFFLNVHVRAMLTGQCLQIHRNLPKKGWITPFPRQSALHPVRYAVSWLENIQWAFLQLLPGMVVLVTTGQICRHKGQGGIHRKRWLELYLGMPVHDPPSRHCGCFHHWNTVFKLLLNGGSIWEIQPRWGRHTLACMQYSECS